MATPLVFAVPKGRVLDEALPLMQRAGLEPEAEFHDDSSRKLQFDTNVEGLSIIRVRAFDAATFVAHGAADFGIVGSDVIDEFAYQALYAPVDLKIGACRLSVAEPAEMAESDDPQSWSHVRVATKYPATTSRHFAAKGVQAECVKLNGAMELAPRLGLTNRIVDLVSSGATLKANELVEVDVISEVTSRLIVSRPAFKRKGEVLQDWIRRFREAAA